MEKRKELEERDLVWIFLSPEFYELIKRSIRRKTHKIILSVHSGSRPLMNEYYEYHEIFRDEDSWEDLLPGMGLEVCSSFHIALECL